MCVRGSGHQFAGSTLFYSLFLFDEIDVLHMAEEIRPLIEAPRDNYGDLAVATTHAGAPTKLDFLDRMLLFLFCCGKDATLANCAVVFGVSIGTCSRDFTHMMLCAYRGHVPWEMVWPDRMNQDVGVCSTPPPAVGGLRPPWRR